MRARTLAAVLLLVASVASADKIAFDPPAATVNHSVDAIVSGIWNDGCAPQPKNVAVSRSTITLTLDANLPPGVGCTAALTPYARIFHLGILPADSYTVIVAAETAGVLTERARASLIVRDADTVHLLPYAVPTTGGRIQFTSAPFPTGNRVTIDGVTVPAGFISDAPPSFDAPPHAPGAVDVTVDLGTSTVTAKAAVIYYDPASTDPAVFEPILFPVSFQGPGSLGSQWTTENFVSFGTPSFFRDRLPCCLLSIAGTAGQLLNNANPWGHILYAIRGTADSLSFSSRIRDTSRQAQTAGTEVPVVRERDFRSRLLFLNVPVDSRYRATLRLWAIGDDPFGSGLRFTATLPVSLISTPVPFLPIPLTKVAGTAMWFGSIDVTSFLTRTPSNPNVLQVFSSSYQSDAVALAFPRVWGMLSITNNDTQQVTIVSPH
jgi:hypothetical protein